MIDLTTIKDKLRVDYELKFYMSRKGYLSFDAECVLVDNNYDLPIASFEFCYEDDEPRLKKCKYIGNAKSQYSELKKLLNDMMLDIEVDFLDHEVELLLNQGQCKGSFDVNRPYIG